MAQRDVVQRWLALSHQVLVDEVHQLVRSHDDRAHRCWNTVREHPVLAARVRGILSALERQSADYRDAAMWRVWIAQARNALTSPRPPTPQPPLPVHETSTAEEELDIDRPRVSSSCPAPPAQMIFREPGQ